MDDIVLEARKLRKVYNPNTHHAFEALHSIDLQVRKGEFIGVMGPSGSGKSTFINNIGTIDTPTDGKVLINGKNVLAMSTNEIGRFRFSNLGFIFQDFNLLESHTMFENIALPLSLAGNDIRDTGKRVRELAEKMDIADHLDKLPAECSGGQKQRAAICRALINHPGIIIADEPTGNLDSVNSEEVLELFQKMNREDGVTIVMVTHDSYIASFTTRVIFISDGSITSEIVRGDMDQDTYFQKIIAVSSSGRGRKRV